MSDAPILLWYRNDLRLSDHPALAAAVARGNPVIPVFVFDEESPGRWAPGGASRWWLAGSLKALDAALRERGSRLLLRRGRADEILGALAHDTGAGAVHFSRRYEPWAIAQEKAVKTALEKQGAEVRRFGGTLLMEPEDIATQSGAPYRVYTPFWRALSSTYRPGRASPPPGAFAGPRTWPRSDRLSEWSLEPRRPNWARGFPERFTPGEVSARQRLEDFLADTAARYADDRNRPDLPGTSRLSPHLAHGEISPRAIWLRASAPGEGDTGGDRGRETFLKELVWREFSSHLLFHFPTLPSDPFRPEFAAFPWRSDGAGLNAWQRGRTGFPIVDAGMRELWATGWMHNRVRMIVASFLIKDLLIPWQEGEAWFWDTLVDADLANNAASWQWVAGSGADAAPYFRIFNPTTQGQKFDPSGDYVRRWVPELAGLPDGVIHAPHTAEAGVLAAAGVELGRTYPEPIVDHKAARERALAALEKTKS
ncbi:MAG: deoxyribodipyrimidine photo-lyase [Hyphomicrobiaceae bacterium]